MLQPTVSKMCFFIIAFVALAVAKPTPPANSPWSGLSKSSSATGASGMGSITVPYMPKSSPFFPKFVDPISMIDKKTAMLSNLFGGLGPFDYTGGATGGFAQYPTGFARPAPMLYATNTDNDIPQTREITSADDLVGKDKMKRGVFGPGGAKYGSPKMSPFSPFDSKFSPFAPQFIPANPPGFPFTGFPSKFAPGFFNRGPTFSRRRRSTDKEGTKVYGPPPAYPGLAPIAEEPETIQSKLLKLVDPALKPKQMLPGMFGPFGPFSPFNPYAAVTEIPIPKSTIVPADFWLPSSIIPGPTEYADKVSTFLSKLFDSLALNKTAPIDDGTGKLVSARSLRQDPNQDKFVIARSIEDIKSIAAAKDIIVDSISSELSDLKTDMISTLNDFILYQKTASTYPGIKKPIKPLSPFAAFFAPPTPDPTLPFKQRMAVLSQVFDMLTGLQKNITFAVQAAIKSSTDAPLLQDPKVIPTDAVNFKTDDLTPKHLNSLMYPNAGASFNQTLFDAVKSRLPGFYGATGFNNLPIMSNFQAPAKRDVEGEDYEKLEYYDNHRNDDRDQYKRKVQMQMHQGYQSMPPGSIVSVQAGGGSVPGHQGGGIKQLDLQNNGEIWDKWSEGAEFFKNMNQGHKHHDHH